jgi:hypothetical protein
LLLDYSRQLSFQMVLPSTVILGRGKQGQENCLVLYVLRLDCSSSSKGGKERNSRDGERGRGLSYITMAIADVS